MYLVPQLPEGVSMSPNKPSVHFLRYFFLTWEEFLLKSFPLQNFEMKVQSPHSMLFSVVELFTERAKNINSHPT